MATLAHALQIIGAWIAPLVIFLINRKSRFVSFHALQALLLQIAHVIVIVVMVVASVVIAFSSIALHGADKAAGPPMAFFIVFPIVWLGLFVAGIGILVLAIVYSIKAGRGEWAEYPVLGQLARKMLKIGPGGAAIPPQT
jgi:uncharacterized membrane protein